MTETPSPIEVLTRFIDDFQFELPAAEDRDTPADQRAYEALEALTTLRNQVEQMEGIIERVTFLAEHWDTWAGVLLREALS